MSPRPKRTEYGVAIDTSGSATADGRSPFEPGEGWTPEHLVLAALAYCSLASLAYHARRASLDVTASATAAGAVTQRADGVWALVDVRCDLDVRLEPEPPDVAELTTKAERGCFVGASLAEKPAYRWTVNGRAV